jgi:hypothetical protein
LWTNDVMDVSSLKSVKKIVTKAQSYDVLIVAMVLYPMGFHIEFWKEVSTYYWPSCLIGNGSNAMIFFN